MEGEDNGVAGHMIIFLKGLLSHCLENICLPASSLIFYNPLSGKTEGIFLNIVERLRETKLASTPKPVPDYSEQPFAIVPNWKQPKYPATGEGFNKLWDIHCGVLVSNEKDQTIDTTTWMDLKALEARENLKDHILHDSIPLEEMDEGYWTLSALSLDLPVNL